MADHHDWPIRPTTKPLCCIEGDLDGDLADVCEHTWWEIWGADEPVDGERIASGQGELSRPRVPALSIGAVQYKDSGTRDLRRLRGEESTGRRIGTKEDLLLCHVASCLLGGAAPAEASLLTVYELRRPNDRAFESPLGEAERSAPNAS
jgi:hypothetical protein